MHDNHVDFNGSIDRRDFLKGLAALTGGAALANAGVSADAIMKNPAQVIPLDSCWRPDIPFRLSNATRELSNRALSGEHGLSMKPAPCALDKDSAAALSADMRYAEACMLAATHAPLRILPGEKIAGSATLLEARGHRTPIADVDSTSHTTIGFHRVLKSGYSALRAQIDERLNRGGLDEQGVDFLNAARLCLDAAGVWHKRHLELLDERIAASSGEERRNYAAVRNALLRVPENPPENFHEAVQSLWFMYAFQRLMGNWSGVGRIDEMLGPYLKADLAKGDITLDEAREILAHFWIKGCEWITGQPCGGGDAQHYQNIVLSGVDANGDDITNEVTYLVLDIVEELHISDFPIAVRVSRNTPKKLLNRIADVQRHGGGIVAIYNEEVVIRGLVKFGYPLEEARAFANDGCWETLIPGRTAFKYSPFDAVAMLQEVLGLGRRSLEMDTPDYETFEQLYAAFHERLMRRVDQHNRDADHFFNNHQPAPLLSLFVEDCIENARGYHSRGARYTVFAPHAGGVPDVANSLLVIKNLVYDRKAMPLGELVDALRGNWDGAERLRSGIRKDFEFYGNDSDEADAMVGRIYSDFAALVEEVPNREGCLRPAGVSTFGRAVEWRNQRQATAAGSRRGDILATNFSPAPGTDKQGPTAAIKSHCKMDFTRMPNGATLELKVLPESVKGQRGRDALAGLMRGFVELGGYFMHIDVVDTAMLLDAQKNPNKYPNLSVRIAGWSARFATLNKDHQDLIIERTQQVI